MSKTSTPSRSSGDAPAAQPAIDPPFSAGFWDRDPRTSTLRRIYVAALVRGTLLTSVVIFAILSTYWGAFWKIKNNIHHLSGWVVDFDSGAIGQIVQEAAFNATGPLTQMSWTVIPASHFPNGPPDVIQAVLDEKCWVAIVVNPRATARLDSAVSTVDVAYNARQAATIYAAEARNDANFPVTVSPMSRAIMNNAASKFAEQHALHLASNPNITTLLTTTPRIVTQPLDYNFKNLRPFDATAATPAGYVGLIYLLISAFILTNMHLTTRTQTGLDKHLRLRSLIVIRCVAPVAMYFFFSLAFSLLSLLFQIPMNKKFGHLGFVILWMMNWSAMCAFGLAIEAVVTLITPRFVSYFVVLWMIFNMSVCLYPIDILPGIFHYGYAAPFYNVNRTVRTIVFSTRNQVGLNFGVQFMWIAISAVTIPLVTWFRRREAVREWWREQELQTSERHPHK